MAPRRESRTQEAGGPTEQTILRATEQILQTTSIGDLAVRDILERADVSRATFGAAVCTTRSRPPPTLLGGRPVHDDGVLGWS